MKKALAVVLLSLVLVPQAFAHAEITPQKVPADSVARLVLHVEGEESVPAVKIAVQLSASLTQVTFEPVPGWKRTQTGRVVTWSGGRIAEGDIAEFVLRAHIPANPGAALTFPTVQTYADGKIVRWIGAESSETPAPVVTLTGAKQPKPPPPPPAETTVTAESDDGDSHITLWLVVAAVLLGIVALGITVTRRRRT